MRDPARVLILFAALAAVLFLAAPRLEAQPPDEPPAPPSGDQGDQRQYGPPPSAHWPKIRLQVDPHETQVYLDGYFAGSASDFRGLFQGLRAAPGEHEIVFYLKGYKTVRQKVEVGPGKDLKLRQTLVKLGPGEASEPPPPPPPPSTAQPPRRPQEPPEDRWRRPGRGYPPAPPGYPPAPGVPERPEPQKTPVQESPEFGDLSIQLQPADAELLIDGRPWRAHETTGPIVVHLAVGKHHVEVRKDGYTTYTADVDVRPGRPATLNVILPPRDQREG